MSRVHRIHSRIFMAAAVALLLVGLLSRIDTQSATTIAVIAGAVLLLGLPHGALDLYIARRIELWNDTRSFIGFHGLYLLVAAATVAACILLPVVALSAFLLISIWHFGDDWAPLPKVLRLAGASAIVIFPVLGDPEGVAAIFRAITATDAPLPSEVPYPLILISFWVIAGAVAAAWVHSPYAAIEIALVALMAYVLPALVFFASYFVLLHSPRHILRHGEIAADLRKGLVVVGYTLVATLTVVALIVVLPVRELALSENVLRGLFIGLAALTMPHTLLLEYRSAAQQKNATATV
ncbi:beta-carotene 15,15'-dioxygenase, Brp/Blh family [Parvularcula sp. ZS-1/3]|uniref:Probable beta-carotene 15,15'-dioxygenase n=1 Tax=Parvularcula mediterranea TaxID=2732508 RepID=A0A7Y3W6B9_9PROT|nr:Brp/Blh family beta-carotene 15,15'-dioxygenase [Parvularcula mediterranea]NNU17690.1 beta-carotene 15,15'-dioxygenase, Brp/Blh family [Parvularcula mediterranea]